jgi:hypothetical protein
MDFLFFDPDVVFGPHYLNLPVLPSQLRLVTIWAIFYQVVYSVVAPLLWKLLDNPKSPPSRVKRPLWYINIVSIVQSTVNSAASIYLLYHSEFRHGLTAQERILGYHRETSMVVVVATGYFVFHLFSAWSQRQFHGMFLVFHAICALLVSLIGFVSDHSFFLAHFSRPGPNHHPAALVFTLHGTYAYCRTSQHLPQFPEATRWFGEEKNLVSPLQSHHSSLDLCFVPTGIGHLHSPVDGP